MFNQCLFEIDDNLQNDKLKILYSMNDTVIFLSITWNLLHLFLFILKLIFKKKASTYDSSIR